MTAPLWSLPIVIYAGGFADNEPASPALDPEELVQLLTSFPDDGCTPTTCGGRDCASKKLATCWSPASYDEGATRSDAAVRAINYAVFDLDHLKPGQLESVLANLSEYEHVVHSTHSSAPEDGCYRLVLPLDRGALPHEWPAVHGGIVRALSLPADPSCGDASRLYACPTKPPGSEPFSRHHRGKALSVDEALEVAAEVGLGQPAPARAPVATAGAVDLGALRQRLTDARRSKSHGDERTKEQAVVLGRILDGEALAPAGERDNTLLRATGLLAYWLPGETPWGAVLELLRPSLAAMDTAPEGFEHWAEVARAQYIRGQANRRDADAESEKLRAAAKRLSDSIKERAAARPEDLGDEWVGQLQTSKHGVKGNEHNARLLVACAPELRGTLRWNEVTKAVEVRGGPMAGLPANVLQAALAGWLQQHYDFQGGARLMGPAILQVAAENPYDPVAEYLGELAWDGQPRLDAFLERYFAADARDPATAEYVRAVSRRWLISLVARGLRPGCKVDTVLILEGAQGTGKSSGLEALVGQERFLDTALELGNKDTMQAIAKSWLVELGELASLRRAETERVKQFVSSKVDKYRPPYGAETLDSPRRCVLVGTTNETGDYLRDPTGNRRYWPVRTGRVDVDGIARDRDLVLAEAVRALLAGERWHLTGDEVRLAAEQTEDRLGETATQEAISRWWYGESPNRRPRRLTTLDVSELALRLPPDRIDHRLRTEIGHAMGALGFLRAKHRGEGGQVRYYEPTEPMLAAPAQTSAARSKALALVPAGKTPASGT